MQNTLERDCRIRQTAGPTPTFLIKVVYSENFSVQGYIQWVEQGKAVPFRSYMELLHLIQEGLYISRKEMTRFRSWELDKGEEGNTNSKVL